MSKIQQGVGISGMDGGDASPNKIFYVKPYVTGSQLVLTESALGKSLIYSL